MSRSTSGNRPLFGRPIFAGGRTERVLRRGRTRPQLSLGNLHLGGLALLPGSILPQVHRKAPASPSPWPCQGHLAGLCLGHLDQVVAEIGFHRLADLADRQGKAARRTVRPSGRAELKEAPDRRPGRLLGQAEYFLAAAAKSSPPTISWRISAIFSEAALRSCGVLVSSSLINTWLALTCVPSIPAYERRNALGASGR